MLNKKTLDELTTMYRCTKCKKLTNLKEMVKVPKSKLFNFNNEEAFEIICKECSQ